MYQSWVASKKKLALKEETLDNLVSSILDQALGGLVQKKPCKHSKAKPFYPRGQSIRIGGSVELATLWCPTCGSLAVKVGKRNRWIKPSASVSEKKA